MIITLILVVVCLISAMTLALTATNHRVTEAARAAVRANGVSRPSLGCILPILACVLIGLWTWYAIDVSDWRFAAIVWVPFATNLIGKAATKKWGPTRG